MARRKGVPPERFNCPRKNYRIYSTVFRAGTDRFPETVHNGSFVRNSRLPGISDRAGSRRFGGFITIIYIPPSRAVRTVNNRKQSVIIPQIWRKSSKTIITPRLQAVKKHEIITYKAPKTGLVKSEKVRSKNPECSCVRDFCDGCSKKNNVKILDFKCCILYGCMQSVARRNVIVFARKCM